MKSNSKEVRNKVYEHIKDTFDELDYIACETVQDKVRVEINGMKYNQETVYKACLRLAQGGTFLISYQDMRDFVNSLNLNNNSNRAFDDVEVSEMYFYLVARELEAIYNGKKYA